MDINIFSDDGAIDITGQMARVSIQPCPPPPATPELLAYVQSLRTGTITIESNEATIAQRLRAINDDFHRAGWFRFLFFCRSCGAEFLSPPITGATTGDDGSDIALDHEAWSNFIGAGSLETGLPHTCADGATGHAQFLHMDIQPRAPRHQRHFRAAPAWSGAVTPPTDAKP